MGIEISVLVYVSDRHVGNMPEDREGLVAVGWRAGESKRSSNV